MSLRFRLFTLFVLVQAVSWPLSPALSQSRPDSGPARNAKAPQQVKVVITSEEMTFVQDENLVTFSGDVVVIREDMTIKSDFLDIHLADTNGGPGEGAMRNIKTIVARGKVRITQEDMVGTSERAVFFVDKELLQLEGGARLTQAQNAISGEVIKFHMAQNRSEVLSSDEGRVEAIFFTREDRPDEAGE